MHYMNAKQIYADNKSSCLPIASELCKQYYSVYVCVPVRLSERCRLPYMYIYDAGTHTLAKTPEHVYFVFQNQRKYIRYKIMLFFITSKCSKVCRMKSPYRTLLKNIAILLTERFPIVKIMFLLIFQESLLFVRQSLIFENYPPSSECAFQLKLFCCFGFNTMAKMCVKVKRCTIEKKDPSQQFT